MKRFILTAGLLWVLCTCHGSTGCQRASAILLAADMNLCDLPMFMHWIETCKVDSGILLLYNISDSCKMDTSYYFPQFRDKGFSIVQYNDPPALAVRYPSAANVSKRQMSMPMIPGINGPLTLLSSGDIAQNIDSVIFHLNLEKRGLAGLLSYQPFKDALARFGFHYIAVDSFGMQEGDVVRVGDQLICGKGTLMRFLTRAERLLPEWEQKVCARKAIISKYNLPEDKKITFFLTKEKLLYHLDLFFTYAGVNRAGKKQFFISYLANKPTRRELRNSSVGQSLRKMYTQFNDTLQKMFPGDYQLDSLPCYINNLWVTGVNGIRGCEQDTPVWYFPVSSLPLEEDLNDSMCILGITEQAYNKVANLMKVVKVTVPSMYLVVNIGSTGIGGGGQSLHCSIGVLRWRQD